MIYAFDDPEFKALNEKLGDEENVPVEGSTLLFAKKGRIEDTADCKALLKDFDPKVQWKRIWKKVFQTSSHCSTIFRGFEDKKTGKIVTIFEKYGTSFVYDFNLKDSFDEIEQLVKFIRKHYMGCDYTSILYNPVTKRVWLTMGDGGSLAADDLTKLNFEDMEAMDELMEDGIPTHLNPEVALDFVDDTIYSDEFDPDAAHGYVPVGYYKEFDY